MNPRKSPSPRRTKKTPKAPKAKPAPFARLMWAIDATFLSPALADCALVYPYRTSEYTRPVLVIDARPESLEAMKEAGAKVLANMPGMDWHASHLPDIAAALMQSWA